jgi:hypothetical protein
VVVVVVLVVSCATAKPATEAETELKQERERMEQERKRWDNTDKIGSQMVPTDHRSGELYQSSDDNYELRKLRLLTI